jgi:hypothetical protein
VAPPGTPVVLPFHHSYLHPIEKITLNSAEIFPPVALTVTTTEFIPDFDEDTFSCGNFGILTGKKIGIPYTATIQFHVKKSCIEENESSLQEVVLYHHDTEWVALETTFDFETEEEYYYTAQTNGFSPFLIGVKKKVLSEETIPISNIAFPNNPPAIEENSPIIQEENVIPTPLVPEENTLTGIFVLILIGWAAFIRLRPPLKKHHLDGW